MEIKEAVNICQQMLIDSRVVQSIFKPEEIPESIKREQAVETLITFAQTHGGEKEAHDFNMMAMEPSPSEEAVKTVEYKTCPSCQGFTEVDNYVNGINFKEECQICKGTGKIKSRKRKSTPPPIAGGDEAVALWLWKEWGCQGKPSVGEMNELLADVDEIKSLLSEKEGLPKCQECGCGMAVRICLLCHKSRFAPAREVVLKDRVKLREEIYKDYGDSRVGRNVIDNIISAVALALEKQGIKVVWE